jgi:hypothetical protein
VSNSVDSLGNLCRNHDHAVLVADDGVAGPDYNAPAAYNPLGLPRLHGSGALLGCGGVAKGGEAVVYDLVGVADRAVGDEAANFALHETEEFDVAANRLPGADTGHDKDIVRSAELKSLILGTISSGRLVLLDVRPGGDKVHGHRTTDALVVGSKGASTGNLGTRPPLWGGLEGRRE